jgi:hypothetical protein
MLLLFHCSCLVNNDLFDVLVAPPLDLFVRLEQLLFLLLIFLFIFNSSCYSFWSFCLFFIYMVNDCKNPKHIHITLSLILRYTIKCGIMSCNFCCWPSVDELFCSCMFYPLHLTILFIWMVIIIFFFPSLIHQCLQGIIVSFFIHGPRVKWSNPCTFEPWYNVFLVSVWSKVLSTHLAKAIVSSSM